MIKLTNITKSMLKAMLEAEQYRMIIAELQLSSDNWTNQTRNLAFFNNIDYDSDEKVNAYVSEKQISKFENTPAKIKDEINKNPSLYRMFVINKDKEVIEITSNEELKQELISMIDNAKTIEEIYWDKDTLNTELQRRNNYNVW